MTQREIERDRLKRLKERGLTTSFVAPNGTLCKELVLFTGTPMYTMLDVRPVPFVNTKMLTSKEITELSPDDIGLSSSYQSL